MKTALVTGGSGYIGKSIVKNLLDNNYFVYIHGSQYDKLSDFSIELSEYSGKFKTIAFDVSNISDGTIVDGIEYESVDVLVNAIGGGGAHESWSATSLEKWKNVYNLNVVAPIFFIKKIISSLRHKNYGRIINISSVSAIKTLSIGPEYSAAKSAVISFSKSLAQEFKNTSVTVNCVSPGLVYTDFVKRCMSVAYGLDILESDDFINKVISEKFYPNLSMGLPRVDEIAKLVIFLCREEAKHITGQNLIIDSGYSLSDFVKGSVE